MRIPAEPNRDADLVMASAAIELRAYAAILDAEGDGGAVGWISPKALAALKETRNQMHAEYVINVPNENQSVPLYTHPARSGVVSDEDVEAAREAYFNAANVSDGVFTDSVAMRAALENFAKGECHER